MPKQRQQNQGKELEKDRVESTQKDENFDPPTATAVDGDDATATSPFEASPSLHSMLERVLKTQSSQQIMVETFMTTQVAHGQFWIH